MVSSIVFGSVPGSSSDGGRSLLLLPRISKDPNISVGQREGGVRATRAVG